MGAPSRIRLPALLCAVICAAVGAPGCYASHEPAVDVEPDPACCNNGVFEVLDGDHGGTVIEIRNCPTGRWRCTVDGVERRCTAGHGSLGVQLTEEFLGPDLSINITDCLGPEATAHIDGEVRLRRLAP